jgi:uncharacterized protein YggE
MKILTLATLLSLLLALQPAPQPAAAAEPPARSISVIGTGSVLARPDTAEVQMVVFTEAAPASSALQDNDVMTGRLLDRLHELGIARKDVRSRRSAVQPQFRQVDPDLTRRVVCGYQVHNDVRAKVRRLDKLGAILDDLGSSGPDLIQDVRLIVGDPRGLYEKARKKALADARRRAQQYAHDAGLELGEVLDVREQSSETDPTQAGGASGADDDEQEFRASISVTYAVSKPLATAVAASR